MPSPTIYFDLGDTLIFGPSNNRQPFPDAVATLATLFARGYLLGLLSDQVNGTTVADVEARLQGFGFGPYIDPITISSELAGNVFKPDPAIFALALQKAGFAEASNDTMFVTENATHIVAARNLGWRAILKRNGSTCVVDDGGCVEDLDGLLDLLPTQPTDLWIRDAPDHTGGHSYSGRFWDSPDLWIRNDDDGGTSHESPESGQDNWFHARVRNRGTGIARNVQVAFNVHPWAGTNFVYPADYLPPITLASAGDIAPGATKVAKAVWSAVDVPPAGTHACWIAAVLSSSELPVSGARVWEHNNLAQKNLTVVDLEPGDSAVVPFRFSNPLTGIRLAHLEIRRPVGWEQLPVALVGAGGRSIADLWRTAAEPSPRPAVARLPVTELELTSPASVVVREAGARAPIRLELAASSVIRGGDDLADGTDRSSPIGRAATLRPGRGGMDELSVLPGRVSPVGLAARPGRSELIGVQVTAPRNSRRGQRFLVDVVERDDRGRTVGGIAIQATMT